MSDINALMAAEEATQTDHIWLVSFEILTEVAGIDGENWVNDELSVAGGPDGLAVIHRVRDHIGTEAYDMKASDFRLTGLKLLAVADF